METLIIAGLISVVVFVAMQTVFRLFATKDAAQQRINEMKRSGPKLTQYADGQEGLALDATYAPKGGQAELTLTPNYSPLATTLIALMNSIGINFEKHRREKGMEYYRAGYNSPNHPAYFLAYQIFVGPLLIVFGAYLLFVRQYNGTLDHLMFSIIAIMALIAGALGRKTLMKNSRAKREKKLTNSFPDALDLLLVCVETGLALDGSLARVTRELGKAAPEVTEELNRTRLELSLLNDRQQALLNLAQRTNLAPYKTLVGALLQSERMGTSLTDTLRVLSEDYRMRRLMVAETKAGRLPVLITVPLIFCMLPALFIVILTPAFIQLGATTAANPSVGKK